MPSIVHVWECFQCFCQCLRACSACGSSRHLLGIGVMKGWMNRRIQAMYIYWNLPGLWSKGTSDSQSSTLSCIFELPLRLRKHCRIPQSSYDWSPRTTCRPAFGAVPVVSPASSALLGLASLQSCPVRLARVAPSAQASFCTDWATYLVFIACLLLRLWICSSDFTGSGWRLFCLDPQFSEDFWGLSFLAEPLKCSDFRIVMIGSFRCLVGKLIR